MTKIEPKRPFKVIVANVGFGIAQQLSNDRVIS